VHKIRAGVIPAAGKGRRILDLPLTRVLPKPILPVLAKPILEYVIANMKKMGVRDIFLIVPPNAPVFQEYFRDGREFGTRITYIEQRRPRGIAHAIGLTREYINTPFAVILGDDLTVTDSFDNLIEIFFKRHAVVAEAVCAEEDKEVLRQTCCVTLESDGKILDIEEKPSTPQSNVRGCGVYVFDPIVYDYIRKTPESPLRHEKELTDTIRCIAREKRAYGAVIKGANININRAADLFRATALLLEKELNRGSTEAEEGCSHHG